MSSMADYLPTKVADYPSELGVGPQRVMPEVGNKKQTVHEFDDGSVSVVTLSSTSYFFITLQWDIISEVDASTIFDMWHNTLKANGREKTFYWRHPKEDVVYVARFMDELTRIDSTTAPNHKEVSQITLKVEGVKA